MSNLYSSGINWGQASVDALKRATSDSDDSNDKEKCSGEILCPVHRAMHMELDDYKKVEKEIVLTCPHCNTMRTALDKCNLRYS